MIMAVNEEANKPVKDHPVKQEHLNQLHDKIQEFMGKYLDLVWYARSRPEDDDRMKKSLEKVLKAFPEECENLDSIESGDWDHGFNSGMLACSRLLITYFQQDHEYDSGEGMVQHTTDGEIVQALEDFPELYT